MSSKRVLRKASKAKAKKGSSSSAAAYEVTVVFNEPGWVQVEDDDGKPRVGADGKALFIPDDDQLVVMLHEKAGAELRSHMRMMDASEIDTATLPDEVSETPTLYVHATKEWYKGGEPSVNGLADWLITKGVEVDLRAMLYGKGDLASKQPMSEAYEAMEAEMAGGTRRTHMVTQGIKRPGAESSVARPRSHGSRGSRGRGGGRAGRGSRSLTRNGGRGAGAGAGAGAEKPTPYADDGAYDEASDEGMISGVVEVGVHGEKSERKYKPRAPGQPYKGEMQAPVKRLSTLATRAGGKKAGSSMGAAHRLDPLEDLGEHLIETVEMALVLDQRGAGEVVEPLDIVGDQPRLHPFEQHEVFAQGYGDARLFQREEEACEHALPIAHRAARRNVFATLHPSPPRGIS